MRFLVFSIKTEKTRHNDGKPFIATTKDLDVKISHSYDHKATLLVYVSVDNWNSTSAPDSTNSYEDLETYINQAARKACIYTLERS